MGNTNPHFTMDTEQRIMEQHAMIVLESQTFRLLDDYTGVPKYRLETESIGLV